MRLLAIPSDIARMPEKPREVFRRCLDKVFTVREVDQWGHLVLWVQDGRDCTRIAGADITGIEPEYVAVVESDVESVRIEASG